MNFWLVACARGEFVDMQITRGRKEEKNVIYLFKKFVDMVFLVVFSISVSLIFSQRLACSIDNYNLFLHI